MIRAFLDSSVFFAACLSPQGASSAILHESIQGHVTLVISDTVREETERNLASLPHRADEALALFQQLLAAIPFALSNPTAEEIAEAATLYVSERCAHRCSSQESRSRLPGKFRPQASGWHAACRPRL